MSNQTITKDASAATTAQGREGDTPEVKNGKIVYAGRSFFAVEVGRQSPGILGPWAIMENNGDGKRPLVHVQGISGSRNNAERVLVRTVRGIIKVDESNAREGLA